MALAKVHSRGQITLPRAIRRAAGFQPGDTLTLRVTGPGVVEIKALPRLTLADLLDRYQVDGPVDVEALLQEAEDAAALEVIEKLGE